MGLSETTVLPREPSHHPEQQHDIVIDHHNRRQIRIDSAHSRISYRDRSDDRWGVREKPVSDLQGATKKLMIVALMLDMSEVRLLGLDGHPAQPEK